MNTRTQRETAHYVDTGTRYVVGVVEDGWQKILGYCPTYAEAFAVFQTGHGIGHLMTIDSDRPGHPHRDNEWSEYWHAPQLPSRVA